MKLRTIFFSSLILFAPLHADKTALDDESLRLMYDSFLFSKDLNHAYTIAQKALKSYPHSLYWHKKMGEVALWTGHNDEAMDHLTYVYRLTDDKKLGDSLIKQMLATYQYKKALPLIKGRLEHTHDHHTVQSVIDVNDKVGKPEESIKTLKKLYRQNPSSKYLASILSLYLETGEISKASHTVKALEKYKHKNIKAALALSKYYFLEKDLQKAYQSLLSVKSKAKKEDTEYFQHLSDLGWYLHDQNNAVYGSMMLYQSKKARLLDYERIQKVYQKKDIALMKDIAKEAIKTHKSKKFLLNYANQAMQKGHFEAVDTLLTSQLNDPKSRDILKKDPKFWLAKAKVDEHFKKRESVQEDLHKALSLAPNSAETTNTILWSLIDSAQYTPLDTLLQEIEVKKSARPSMYHALSAAYLTLQKPDKALFFLHKINKNDPLDMDLKFLHSEILAAQGRSSQRRDLLKEILNTLQTQSDKDPALLKNKQFLRRYLQASIEFTNDAQWKRLLDAAKPHVAKRDYLELQILNALKYKNYQEVQALYQQTSQQNPQLEIELAHAAKDNTQERALIQHYALATPKAIMIENAETEDQITQAITYNQLALQENSTNPYLVNKLQELYTHYNHHYQIGAGYATRGALKTLSFEFSNFYYIAKGYGLITEIKDFEQSSTNLTQFSFEKSDDMYAHIGLRKAIKDGVLEAGITYRHAQENALGVRLKADKGVSDSLRLQGMVQTNARVHDQSIAMQVGGKQDRVTLQATYALTDNQYLSILGEYDNYKAQDGVNIGSGIRANLTWDYSFSHQYDTGMRVFYSLGQFDEKNQKGSISELLKPDQQDDKLLQNDYKDTGIGFYYGDKSKIFGKNFNPYIDVAAVYSGNEKRFYTLLETGITGALSQKDFYNLGLQYQNAINGIDQEELSLYLNYSQRY